MLYEQNEVLKRLPEHLRQFINNQDYESYTPIDQAVWRYVMRKNVDYLKQVAHGSYLEGLDKTGISTEQIPNMYGMNRILKDIGWAAVAVDGFIPPTAFMEFQAYNVLVIAQDIRQIQNLEYTPSPDIIHESAGHAPIIANPEYAEYLRRFGEIGGKAISSSLDYELYEAIRHLSIVKEDRHSDPKTVELANERVLDIQNSMTSLSEMAKIRNLHWWTVEYGLIGSLEHPKIYGAGLLSSIGESKWCMQDQVKKLPYDLQASEVSFDITKPQPQLYVTPDFAYLNFVLEQFANNMGLRRGGASCIRQLIESKNLGTIEYNTGIQVSGLFTHVITDEQDQPIYIQTKGKTALSYHENELIGHGTNYHAEGFGSPVGKLKNINIAIENMFPHDLEAYNIREGELAKLEFVGGITVEGEVITGTRNRKGKILLISFKNCTVKYFDEILFHPSWGVYDMAIGKSIVSAYAGPADYQSFDFKTHVLETKDKIVSIAPKEQLLREMYQTVRAMRERNAAQESNLIEVFNALKTDYPDEWLLAVEIYELAYAFDFESKKAFKSYLMDLSKKNEDVAHLIIDGIALIEK
ncbi:aromatic amino acid hydroxylase [Sphingobacterium hungaricum]|uniref:Aromatic amino acid hydroxylase n=1 Tax=Sphingobacterium hungaricum TaxID=2082723 RepID=A0A928YNX2_9SPHI|nr:aromatic amino acid hydroxylase [Sphingobacterium hungaricum]MBE8712319.1 aromatic amino acid hydroxylase [Sphingobacterium hungaricum]